MAADRDPSAPDRLKRSHPESGIAEQVGAKLGAFCRRIGDVARLADDLDGGGMGREQAAQEIARGRFVVDEESAEHGKAGERIQTPEMAWAVGCESAVSGFRVFNSNVNRTTTQPPAAEVSRR